MHDPNPLVINVNLPWSAGEWTHTPISATEHGDDLLVTAAEGSDAGGCDEALAIAVLTALGERDALVRDAERRAGQALRTMTEDEGLSVREAVDWCGSGVTVREITRLLRLDDAHQSSRDERVG